MEPAYSHKLSFLALKKNCRMDANLHVASLVPWQSELIVTCTNIRIKFLNIIKDPNLVSLNQQSLLHLFYCAIILSVDMDCISELVLQLSQNL